MKVMVADCGCLLLGIVIVDMMTFNASSPFHE